MIDFSFPPINWGEKIKPPITNLSFYSKILLFSFQEHHQNLRAVVTEEKENHLEPTKLEQH